MYNEELKLLFLESDRAKSAKSQLQTLFRESEKLESEVGKDLSDFNESQIIALINSMACFDPHTAKIYLYQINKYRGWAMPGSEVSIKREQLDFVSAIRSNLYVNEADLVNELKTSVEFDQGFFVVPAICLVWLGVDPNEIGFLPKANVDINKGVIKNLNGDIVVNDIPEEIKSVLTTFATTYVGIRTQNRTFEVHPKDEGQFLYRMVTKNSNKTFKPITRKNISVEVVILRDRIATNTGSSKLSIYNVEKSGILNRVYKFEKSGVDVFSTAAREQVQSLFKNKNDIFDNLFLYRKYKEAFNLQ